MSSYLVKRHRIRSTEIETTKNEVESFYNKANGFEHDAEVIYGDTDSVMVQFGTSDLATAMDLGKSPRSSLIVVVNREPRRESRNSCYREFCQTNQVGIREGILPLPVDKQEAICRPLLDKT